MSKEPPTNCEKCGEQPPNPRHYPLAPHAGQWWCKRCRDNERKAKEQAAKQN